MKERKIVSLLEDKRVFEPPAGIKLRAYIKSLGEYKKLYERSIRDPEEFWGELAEQLNWYKKWDKVLEWDFFTKDRDVWWHEEKARAAFDGIIRQVLRYIYVFLRVEEHYHQCLFLPQCHLMGEIWTHLLQRWQGDGKHPHLNHLFYSLG